MSEDTSQTSEDLIFEDDSLGTSDTVKSLREKLLQCQKERDEHLIGWQRARADQVNYKRTAQEDADRRVKLAITPLVRDLSSILDSFDSAIKIDVSAGEGNAVRDGVIQVQGQFLKILAQYGVSLIDPIGEPFDPHRHEAVGTTPTSTPSEDHIVASVMQKGLELEHTLIRPAKVILFVTS